MQGIQKNLQNKFPPIFHNIAENRQVKKKEV